MKYKPNGSDWCWPGPWAVLTGGEEAQAAQLQSRPQGGGRDSDSHPSHPGRHPLTPTSVNCLAGCEGWLGSWGLKKCSAGSSALSSFSHPPGVLTTDRFLPDTWSRLSPPRRDSSYTTRGPGRCLGLCSTQASHSSQGGRAGVRKWPVPLRGRS